jgi:glutaredoxin
LLNRIRAKLGQILNAAVAPPPPSPARASGVPKPAARREPVPVMVYFEKDRNQRLIERVRELLESKQIPFRALDVSGDAATLSFVVREAKCEDDDLPIVFVGGTVIGGFNDLVDWDVSGKLKTAVFGPSS